jgi:hypothetical protein
VADVDQTTDNCDADQRLLAALAALESAIQRNGALTELVRGLASQIAVTNATATTAGIVPLPTALAVPMPDCSASPASALQFNPPANTVAPLSDHPLASHALALLPLEYQHAAHQALDRIGTSRRTLLLSAATALAAGIYTGHVTIPAALKNAVIPTCTATPNEAKL